VKKYTTSPPVPPHEQAESDRDTFEIKLDGAAPRQAGAAALVVPAVDAGASDG
jgi:hypothetical protein